MTRIGLSAQDFMEGATTLFALAATPAERRRRARRMIAWADIELREAMSDEINGARNNDYADVLTKLAWAVENLDNWGPDFRG